MYVPLARRWVAAGHVVLRLDLGGIGDSAPPPGEEANDAYPKHMLDDARDAIAFVRRSAPDRPVVVAGLCSGAWLAFRAAAEDLDVDGIAAINPPLYLREGDGGKEWRATEDEIERYRQSIRVPEKWAKVLRGRASYTAFIHVAAGALRRRVANSRGAAFGYALGHGFSNDLVAIARRRVRSLFVFSARGDGLAYFEEHARPAFRDPSVRNTVQHVVIEGAGHCFRPRAAQQRMSELLTTFIDEIGRRAETPRSGR
jgi:dienelactone hydrolase